jgi:hypothetical protein
MAEFCRTVSGSDRMLALSPTLDAHEKTLAMQNRKR